MSERLPELAAEVVAAIGPPRSPRRRRFLILSGCMLALLLTAIVGLYFWASSAGFERLIRQRTINLLQQATGGRVEIRQFRWHLVNLEAEAAGVVLHGTEDRAEEPYAQVDHLLVRFSLLGFWSPRVLVRDLEITRPTIHIIIYPDGSTNQPRPHKPAKQSRSGIDTLFDLQAGRVLIEDGVVRFEDRAASFDFQNRYIPLNLDANGLMLRMTYLPPPMAIPGLPAPSASAVESYRIEARMSDLILARGTAKPSHGSVLATLDLTRSAAYLRSLRINSPLPATKNHAAKNLTLEIAGALQDFAHPHWQGRAIGDLDLSLLEPIFGYPFAPEGIAHLSLDGAGQGGQFHTDGSIHIEGGSYIGTGVVATGVRLDAQVHADPGKLLITSIVARPSQGGELEGEIALAPWLPLANQAAFQRQDANTIRATGDRNVVVRTPPAIIPVNGKVTAHFRDVSLDTVLDMVSQRPFQRLGLDTRINGTANANWVKGDANTVAVDALLKLSPSVNPVAGEIPTSGVIDGVYTQRDGAVALRNFEVHTQASTIQAHGRLGAFPLSSASGLTVDLHSTNLADFDTVLRDLGLNRYGKSGTAALPVTLAGQADFHGSWQGSLVEPRIAGTVKASQISVEMVPIQPPKGSSPQPPDARPRWVHWDAIDATGSYAPERIVMAHALLRRGNAEVSLSGTLDAAAARAPEFDSNSVLHAHLHAARFDLDDILPLLGQHVPVTGILDAELQADGPIRALGGSGWAELNSAVVYGEPLIRLRVQGSVANQLVKLSGVTATAPAGAISASGSYDLKSRHFEGTITGSGIDISRIESFPRHGVDMSGKVQLSASGSGTLDDPHIQAHATFASLVADGESLGALDITAHSTNRAVIYDANTRLEAAELSVHGQTALNADYTTQARLEFTHFDIGALLKRTHLQGLTGESALAGDFTIDGPLARPAEMRGDARLQDLAVTIDAVNLKSQGGLHATLAGGRVALDPVHIVGEETDLHAQGSLGLKDKQQLDFAASGSVNLKLAQMLDPDLTAGGTTTFQVEAHGPLAKPDLRGRIDFNNGFLSLEDVPNGLSQLHGTLEFNQNRLEVRSLTAMSGGGLLSVGGYLAYQHGIYADLSVTGKSIRIRYPQGVSSLADANLHLFGSQNNLLLAGDVVITRFSVSPDLDIAALATQANAVQTIAPPDAPSNHIRLDVHLASSPQLNFQNAFAKLAGNVDLHLRGTVASPSLLGRVSITEGTATIAGTRYELQRGDIFFTNPVRIEPSIDLNATAHVDDYDITLGLHGTPDKLNVNYRSDPPLPEADVVALLALGRTQDQQRLYTAQQEQSANPATDALLGGALNATVSSRVQKLFGAGSVKVDPNYLGALGNSTSRIIVEEQLGRNLTLTYATNVDTTGQQLIQAEVAINRHVSLLVARDESGVFSMVVKATRRYR